MMLHKKWAALGNVQKERQAGSGDALAAIALDLQHTARPFLEYFRTARAHTLPFHDFDILTGPQRQWWAIVASEQEPRSPHHWVVSIRACHPWLLTR